MVISKLKVRQERAGLGLQCGCDNIPGSQAGRGPLDNDPVHRLQGICQM
jgi:hypothetical protein